MADNVTVDNGTGTDYGVATDKVTHSGDADQSVQLFRPVHVTGSEGSKTVEDWPYDVNGLHVVINSQSNALAVSGDVAHDFADSGFPVKIGGFASDGIPATVADGDRVNARFDQRGALIVRLVAQDGQPLDSPGEQALDVSMVASAPLKTIGGTAGETINGNGQDFAFSPNRDGSLVTISGTWTGTLQFESSIDSGSTWGTVRAYPLTANGTPGTPVTSTTANGQWLIASTVEYLRVRSSAWTSGTAGIAAFSNELVPHTLASTVAHDDVDGGNPIKIGGRASSVAPTAVTTGDRVNAWFGNNGQLASMITGDTGTWANVGLPADAFTNMNGLVVVGKGHVFNGTNWDRMRSGGATGFLGVTGAAAHASPTSGNPIFVAGRASAVIPTDVGADGDVAGMWTNRNGAQVIVQAPHVGLNSDPWNLVHEGAQYTSAQTSTVLVAGGASEKIVVTKVQIQAYGTTAGTAILYFGTGAYSRGTSRAIFDGEFAPSSTLKPGVVMDGPFIAGTNGDDLMVTTTNALSITFSVWYYVVT